MQPDFKETEIGRIPEDWEVKKIGEIAKVVGGGTPRTSDLTNFEGGTISWITPKDLSNHLEREIFLGERNITQKGLDSSGAKLLPKGTVLLSSRAPIGYIAIAGKTLTTNQGFRSLVLIDGYSSEFIYYQLKTKRKILENHASGSTFKEISGSVLKQIELLIPPLPEQHRIAEILGALDDKIELNQRMNKTLEEMAQAIFKHWFVDFEFPNEDGEPYKSSGGEMVYSEELEKEIPEGWEVGKLGEIADFKNGINYKRYEEGNTTYPIVNVRNIANSKFLINSDLDSINIDKKKAKPYYLSNGSILIARSAIPGKISMLRVDYENVIYSGFIIKLDLFNPELKNYIVQYLEEKIQALINLSDGTTLKNINQRSLKGFNLVFPSKKIIKEYNMLVNEIFNYIYCNKKQIRTLSQIRDTLLPKLMSGEIRVKVEEKDVGEENE